MILCALCCASFAMSAQTNSWAQRLVNNIVTDVNVTPEQVTQLQTAAEEYLTALQQTKQKTESLHLLICIPLL